MDSASINDQQVLRNASATQLERAVAENHRQLFCYNTVALGGVVQEAEGLTYTYTPNNGSAVVFPAMAADKAGALLDTMMDFYRANKAQNVGYWSLDPSTPADVDARLLARGFQTGWKPCWMSLDVAEIRNDFPAPAGLEIKATNEEPVHEVAGLPYGDNGGVFSDALLHNYPEKAQRFVAYLNDVIVGQTCLFFTTGADGIAGMYNVGVVPTAQRQGIGKALVIAASQYARDRGYQYVMLNANNIGRAVYERVGFQFISYGLTWWLMGHRYITHPPAPNIVALAEAAGNGDMDSLNRIGASCTPEELNTPLANGMMLVQLAAHGGKAATVEWLGAHGATITPLDAWDLGWKEKAAQLLATDPQGVNRTYFDWQGTLLHVAAQRNDKALAQLALNAGIDLSIKDKEHDGIALGWAYYFHHTEIVKLINEYAANKSKTGDQ